MVYRCYDGANNNQSDNLISYPDTLEFIKLAQIRNIDTLMVRTGAGLLTDTADPAGTVTKLYMGLEGHTHEQSLEAIQDHNIERTPSTGKITQHRHLINGSPLTPAYHESDFIHYGWQVVTVAPLYFVVKQTPFLHSNTNIYSTFVQALPAPTKQLEFGEITKLFRYEVEDDITYISTQLHNNNHLQHLNSSDTLAEIYRAIWQECNRINYLYCTTLNGQETMDFTKRLYRKQ